MEDSICRDLDVNVVDLPSRYPFFRLFLWSRWPKTASSPTRLPGLQRVMASLLSVQAAELHKSGELR